MHKMMLEKYNLKYLREIAKKYKIKISGKKRELIERLQKTFFAITIQRIFRGSFIRSIYNAKNIANMNKKMIQCVNECDFYTMDDLHEIPRVLFYIITQKTAISTIYYGFNIESLIQLIRKTPDKQTVKNPYTRNSFSNRELDSILYRYDVLSVYFSNHVNPMLKTSPSAKVNSSSSAMSSFRIACMRNLQFIRTGSIVQRIRGVFMEMDSLGNYTDFSWFENLQLGRDFRRFYRVLYNIWFYHAGLTNDMRRRICIIGDPFENIIGFINTLDVNIMREKCVRVIENIIFCGQEIEDRRIGAFHILTALTVVSMNARIAMPWLYESLI